jgi:hypothetical protein
LAAAAYLGDLLPATFSRVSSASARPSGPSLFRYLDEQTHRFNNRKMTDSEPLSAAADGIVGKRLTFDQ